jgi:HAD superfamily hydrolase (TIGR01549 family)
MPAETAIGRIEAVTFDVGLTLLAHRNRELRRQLRSELSAWLRAHGLRLDGDALRPLRTEAELRFARLQAGGSDGDASEATDDFVASMHLDLTRCERAELQGMLERIARECPTVAPDGAMDALRCLREHGVKLGIVSNRGKRSGRMTQRYLEQTGLESLFEPDAIVWSDEVGIRKPDPRIFLLALEALGTPPERAAHVGDNVRWDVVAAREIGMVPIYYVGLRDHVRAAPGAHAVIHDYRDLPRVLGFDDTASGARSRMAPTSAEGVRARGAA